MEKGRLPQNAITLEQAKEWISNWKNRGTITTSDIIAHLIPAINIESIKVQNGWQDYRGYNAITNEGEFKLLLVGTDANKNDLVDYENGLYVYDLSEPCPNTCSNSVWR
jgi:hypothetical protein